MNPDSPVLSTRSLGRSKGRQQELHCRLDSVCIARQTVDAGVLSAAAASVLDVLGCDLVEVRASEQHVGHAKQLQRLFLRLPQPGELSKMDSQIWLQSATLITSRADPMANRSSPSSRLVPKSHSSLAIVARVMRSLSLARAAVSVLLPLPSTCCSSVRRALPVTGRSRKPV